MEKEMYLKIGRPQNVCVRCGAPIAQAGKHLSAISSSADTDSADTDPVREDFCPGCWQELQDKDYFSFWLARRDPPKPRKIQNRKQRNATLLSYFDYLAGQDNPDYAQHVFFLAHLLMKYSVLRWLRTEPPAAEGAGERIVFRNTVTDDEVAVESVELDDERIAAIKKEIDEYLDRAVSEE